MKIWQGPRDKNGEETAPKRYISAGILTPPAGATTDFTGWSNLTQLSQSMPEIRSGLTRAPLSSGVFLGLFEPTEISMLEAELVNQKILPAHSSDSFCGLAQHASIEINNLRWRARRAGLNVSQARFVIDVPRYLLQLAGQALERLRNRELKQTTKGDISAPFSLTVTRLDDPRALEQMLTYFEHYAAYLLGASGSSSGSLDKGLRLVLRILSYPRKYAQQTTAPEPLIEAEVAADQRTIVLPISVKDCLEQLRKS